MGVNRRPALADSAGPHPQLTGAPTPHVGTRGCALGGAGGGGGCHIGATLPAEMQLRLNSIEVADHSQPPSPIVTIPPLAGEVCGEVHRANDVVATPCPCSVLTSAFPVVVIKSKVTPSLMGQLDPWAEPLVHLCRAVLILEPGQAE